MRTDKMAAAWHYITDNVEYHIWVRIVLAGVAGSYPEQDCEHAPNDTVAWDVPLECCSVIGQWWSCDLNTGLLLACSLSPQELEHEIRYQTSRTINTHLQINSG